MLFKDFDGKPKTEGGYIVAYASTFDREPDLHGDVIAKGAFTETLKDWQDSGKPIPLIFNHSFDDPKYNIGHVVEAKQDEHGLLIKAAFDAENETAQYVRKLVQEGRMWKMSFGSIVEEAAWVQLNEGDRREFREIRKAKLIEVSIVQIPANEHAEILEVKSGDPEAKKAQDRDHGKDRSGAWKRVRREAFERDKKKKAPCAICGKPINYERGLSTRGGDDYDPLAYEPSHIKSVEERPDLELDLDNIQASHAGCNRGNTHNGDRADSKTAGVVVGISPAFDDIKSALMKAAAGFSCSINLQLTDTNGNVVSTIPLTATLVDDEGNPLSSLLPDTAEEIEDPQPEEGDSSDPEASESGETGAPEDGDLLSEIQSILGDE